MALDFDAFAITLLLAPFFVAVLAPLIVRETGAVAGWILAIVPAGIFAALASMIGEVAGGRIVRFGVDWVPALDLRFDFLIDGLSLTFCLVVSGIGAFILIYAGSYQRTHPQRGRFMAILLGFTGSMLGLVLSDSLVALFVFWELTAVASYLLIGVEHERQAARRAALQALIVTTIGGLALLAGGVLLNSLAGTWDISRLADSPRLMDAVWSYPIVFACLAVAAFTKSAQLPFHVWLPNAMEAPTPVSAFLHSAAMVQAGIYLLARFSPLMSDTWIWQGTLCLFGGATLLWGALRALGQTDLKQILAQTTIASLGLMMVLLGFGDAVAAMAVAAYFVAHALYKAGLFLVTGIIDHGTGTRDVTRLGGLRDHLTISFICAALAAISMFGLPPFLGWFAKDEIYADLHVHDVAAIVGLVTLVVGNILMGASALTLGLKPFMGPLVATPEAPHEGGFALWIGPALFGLLGFAVVFAVSTYGDQIIVPMAAAIVGHKVDAHRSLAVDPFGLPLVLSAATWVGAGLLYWRAADVRAVIGAMERRFTWSVDRGFDAVMFGLIRFAGGWTRLLQHGRLELYLVLVFAALALAVFVPLSTLGAWPGVPAFAMLTPYEWGGLALAVAGIVAVVLSPTRLGAILALGLQGLALALLFLYFGAPDLGFTQLLVEVLSVVVLALVMTRLRLSPRDPRPLEDWLRDGTLALICGAGITLVLLRVLEGHFDSRLGDFFASTSVALAHGRNIVNVILVDYRGLDTLGEITVVMTAGIAVLALLRRQHKRKAQQ
jgi:multicomponent Na+:H+ antiporter subunit A